MERRSVLQNILNITASFSPQSTPSTSSSKEHDLTQPRVALGSASKIFPRLLATGLSKKLSSKINAIYHNRATRLQEVVAEQLEETWLNLCRKSILDDKLLKARFKVLAGALTRQLKEGRNRLVEIAIDTARNYAEETRSQPRPKWNKKFVPVFEWVFDHAFGQYPSLDERHRLAQASGLTYRQIVVWFQNRRARSKKRLAAEAAALARAEHSSESGEPEDLHPSFVELLREDPRIRPKRLLAEHLAALSPPSSGSVEIIDPSELEIVNDGRFPSIREEEELILQEEYLCGVRLNELDQLDTPPYSFPQQMEDHLALPTPFFPSPEWPRQPVDVDPTFMPVRRDEVALLHMQLKNLSVSPPPEDEIITTLCEGYSILDLDGANPSLDAEASASDLVPELEDDLGESEEEDGPSSPITNSNSPIIDGAFEEPALSNTIVRSPEQSLRILKRGVGKVPLLRMMSARAGLKVTRMAPPPRPRPKKLAVCKNIFNGRPKSIRKCRLPIIRELPPLPQYIQPQAQITIVENPVANIQTDVNGNEDEQTEEEEEEDEDDVYGEYIEEYDEDDVLEDVEGVQYYCDDEDLERVDADVLQTSNKSDSGNSSPEESEASFSGSSCFDSDLEDVAMSLATMERGSLSVIEIDEYFQEPRTLELPACFSIPFDPIVAESALKETLEQLGITPNWAMPIREVCSVRASTFQHLVPDIDEEFEYSFQDVDLVAFSNEFTDYFYAPNATVDLGFARPTAMEEYQATLPDPTDELVDLPIPEYGQTVGYDQPIDLAFLISGYQEPDLAYLSSIIEPSTTAAPPLPAIVASQESYFPEEYGDGSQYLVLDHAYDLNELEQDVLRLPSFLPPGGIPSGDRYPFIEPPPLESYARPQPEECKIFVTHGPTQVFYPPPTSPSLPIRPAPPPIIVPAPIQESAMVSSQPHLPPSPFQGTDGTEASRSLFSIGLNSLMSIITSAPRYILGGGSSEPPTTHIEDNEPLFWESEFTSIPAFEEELRLEPESTSIWSTLPHLDDIIYFF